MTIINPYFYFAIAALAAAIFAFTASRLKLAPFCIGRNSTAVMASLWSADAPWGARITRKHPSYWLGCPIPFLSCSMT
jgi:hypothetical protein